MGDNLFIGLQKRYGDVKNVGNDEQMTKLSFFATLGMHPIPKTLRIKPYYIR